MSFQTKGFKVEWIAEFKPMIKKSFLLDLTHCNFFIYIFIYLFFSTWNKEKLFDVLQLQIEKYK